MASDGALIPEDEADRLAAIRRYDVLDTPPDRAFERITAFAAKHFDVPIALVTVVDADRIWFKSRRGVEVPQISRDTGLSTSELGAQGPPVGWYPNPMFHQASARLHRGETLVVFTDGVTQARNRSGVLGAEGLAAGLTPTARTGGAQARLDALEALLVGAEIEFRDDAAALAIRAA